MKRLAGFVVVLGVMAGLAYVGLCVFLYATEDRRMFFPEPLAADYTFTFPQRFEENPVPFGNGHSLDTLLFTSDSSRGVIFFLGGDGGNMRGATTASAAAFFVGAGFDFFQMDYPGFGKSEGKITSEDQLNQSVLSAYDFLRQRYQESQITVVGYSLGTAPAAHLACSHHPQRLVLLAPFYSNVDFEHRVHPYFPMRFTRYPMRTDLELSRCDTPVSMFHGEDDQVIPVSDSVRLKALMKPADTLVIIPKTGHGDLPDSPDVRRDMTLLLSSGIRQLAAPPKRGTIRVK